LGLTILDCSYSKTTQVFVYLQSFYTILKKLLNALKKNKIRYKSIDLLARREDQTPVAIADIANLKISRSNFREYFIVVASFRFSGSQKRKRRWLLFEKNRRIIYIQSVSHSGRPIALLPCASIILYEPLTRPDEATCAVRKLMTGSDNTLMVLENNSLADIAF
jgi:hypothetical protein